MHCEHCGAEIPAGAAFCPGCGQHLTDAPVAGAAPNSPVPASAKQLSDKAQQVRSARDVPEQELWRGAYAFKSMLGMFAIGAAATIVAIVLLILVKNTAAWWIILGILLVIWVAIGGTVFRRRVGTRYRLTNQRFFIETGIFRRVTDRIEVIDINDMKYEQNLFERMFDVGSISLTAADHSVPQLTLDGIEHVVEVANLIDQARRAERNRRGMYIETS